jgi:hypothetical protein
MRALVYFEIFSYPLTAEEIFQFSNYPDATLDEVSEKLQNLVKQSLVFRFDSFFQIKNDPSWVLRRLDCNRRADRLLPLARRIARFIGGFPYVRGVFVSGSLSKHSMSADSDIDFFIVTQPGRLWLARTLLVLFKKIFLFNSHKYFCVNYFLDTEHLEIEEKNLFTATEIATLLPMYGRDSCEAFRRSNGWVREFLPHFPPRPIGETPPCRCSFFKKTLEFLLASRLFGWLDAQAMRLTLSHWRRKFRHLDDGTFRGAFKSARHVSKHHPLYFQQRVLEQYGQRVAHFSEP